MSEHEESKDHGSPVVSDVCQSGSQLGRFPGGSVTNSIFLE